MKVAVRYFTRSGNTKKLAEQVASVAGVEAKDVSEKLTEDVDVLFLGSSVYAAGVDDAIKEFIKNPGAKVGKLVNVSTAALLPSTYKQVKKLAEDAGLSVADEEFHCRGSFGPMHAGRPNAKDLTEVSSFAKKVLCK